MVPPVSRRACLRGACVLGGVGLAGCTGRLANTGEDTTGNTEDTRTDPPGERVGSEAYLERLARRAEAADFPRPDPDFLPELTEARYVEAAARAANRDDFAASVQELRAPVLEPLYSFDEAMAELGAADHESPKAERESLEARLNRRTGTFLDYPTPPHHFVEAAETRGRERLDVEDDPDSDDLPGRYLEDRKTVRAVVAGGRAVTEDYLDEVGFDDGTPGESGSTRRFWTTYESPERYTDVVSFNIGLAAESWLEERGEIPRPP